jgi:uncharacterized membrane protein
MNCPNCQAELPPNSTFCSHCGAHVSSGGSIAAPPPRPVQAGLSENSAAAIAYITIIPAIIFLIMEPYSRMKFVRFHAMQCIGLAVVWAVINVLLRFLPVIRWGLYPLVGLAFFIAWLICIFKASQGQWFKLPLIGDFAEQQAGV